MDDSHKKRKRFKPSSNPVWTQIDNLKQQWYAAQESNNETQVKQIRDNIESLDQLEDNPNYIPPNFEPDTIIVDSKIIYMDLE
jgi:hypothetical protein